MVQIVLLAIAYTDVLVMFNVGHQLLECNWNRLILGDKLWQLYQERKSLNQLLPGLNALFGEEYNNYENEHKPKSMQLRTLKDQFEEELKLSGFGAAPVKDEGVQVSVTILHKNLLWLATPTKQLQWDFNY